MLTVERKLLIWAEKNLYGILLLFFSLAGLLIRVSLRHFFSDDAGWYLLPWYEQIVEQGGIGALSRQVGNYNILYQFLIAIMTYLPVEALYAYKILSCCFDYLLALAAGYLVWQITGKETLSGKGQDKERQAEKSAEITGKAPKMGQQGAETEKNTKPERNARTEKDADTGRKWKGLAAYAIVLLSPVVFANSAVWAQCDSIYAFWIILTMIFLLKEKYVHAFLFFGIAAAFKLQAVFFLPFLLFVYFYSKKFTILNFGIIPAVMFISGIPGFVMGRPLGDIFKIYMEQTETYPRMSSSYPSFWIFISNSGADTIYNLYKVCAIVFAICALGGWMAFWIVKKVEMERENMVYMAFLLVYTAVLFLPAMHERYGYVYEVLAIVIAILHKKTIPLCAALVGMSMFSYGSFLHYRPVDFDALAILNYAVYIAYGMILTGKMTKSLKTGTS